MLDEGKGSRLVDEGKEGSMLVNEGKEGSRLVDEGKEGSRLVNEEGAWSRVADWLDRLGIREVLVVWRTYDRMGS